MAERTQTKAERSLTRWRSPGQIGAVPFYANVALEVGRVPLSVGGSEVASEVFDRIVVAMLDAAERAFDEVNLHG